MPRASRVQACRHGASLPCGWSSICHKSVTISGFPAFDAGTASAKGTGPVSGHMVLLNIVGAVAVLLWGTEMVKAAMLRGFGPGLRRLLGAATRGPVRAATAGVGAAAALQSSTATTLLVAGFVERGMVPLAGALAVVLGADLGTTLVVQALSFDLSSAVPVLLAGGLWTARVARTDRWRQGGRIAIGLGLMILALGLLVEASQPMRDSALTALLLDRLAGDPILAVLAAAALTWLFHSSVAFVLFTMSLAGTGVIDLNLALLLVIGANLGAGFIPLGLLRGAEPGARRLLWGNLGLRAAGALAAFALLGWVAPQIALLPGDAARQVAMAHTLLNLALLVLGLPLVAPLARILLDVLPDQPSGAGAPRRLDPGLIARPPLALNAATRALLGMADRIEAMLADSLRAFETGDAAAIAALRGNETAVDAMQEEVEHFLVELLRSGLDPETTARVTELLHFATDLEHVGDIIDTGLVRMVEKKRRLGLDFSEEGWRDIRSFHARAAEQLRLALAVLVSRDPALAGELVAAKDGLRALEVAAAERHLAGLREGSPAAIESSALHLDVLRDLKRVTAHLTTIAHPLLEERGLLRGSRLKAQGKRV